MLDLLLEKYNKKHTARDVVVENENLTAIDLNTIRADSLEFNKVDLSDSSLQNSQWRNAQFTRVSLENASLESAKLRMCRWQQVQAVNTNFSNAKFEDSTASACVFDGANFFQGSLVDSDFSRASFKGASLEHAELTGANFRGADLRGANLKNIDFTEVDLRGADLTGAVLDGANFEGADIRGALFDDAAQITDDNAEPGTEFSPQMQELADTLSPLVAGLLKTGSEKELYSNDVFASMMKELENATGSKESSPNETQENMFANNEMIQMLLSHVGKTGIEPLLAALSSDSDTPSDAVADLLMGLSEDLKLDDQATTEDLMSALLKGLQTGTPSKPKRPKKSTVH